MNAAIVINSVAIIGNDLFGGRLFASRAAANRKNMNVHPNTLCARFTKDWFGNADK